ncbi:MAG TPA: hypothetical protein VMH88_04265 [Gemmatimonadales bacterium]|nr:hypothetical protein [Gemmatimonadales bacterium]
MRRLWVMLAFVVVPALAAQEPGTPVDSDEAVRLRQDIETRYGERVRQVLGLTDDQAAKLRATQERFRDRRQAYHRQQLALRGALAEQMRPGVAANSDSVRGLMDRISANRLGQVQLEQEENREMAGYLTPVQRAQYQIMRERLLQRVAQERYQRGGQAPRGLRGAEGGGGGGAGGAKQPPPRQRRPR